MKKMDVEYILKVKFIIYNNYKKIIYIYFNINFIILLKLIKNH